MSIEVIDLRDVNNKIRTRIDYEIVYKPHRKRTVQLSGRNLCKIDYHPNGFYIFRYSNGEIVYVDDFKLFSMNSDECMQKNKQMNWDYIPDEEIDVDAFTADLRKDPKEFGIDIKKAYPWYYLYQGESGIEKDGSEPII